MIKIEREHYAPNFTPEEYGNHFTSITDYQVAEQQFHLRNLLSDLDERISSLTEKFPDLLSEPITQKTQRLPIGRLLGELSSTKGINAIGTGILGTASLGGAGFLIAAALGSIAGISIAMSPAGVVLLVTLLAGLGLIWIYDSITVINDLSKETVDLEKESNEYQDLNKNFNPDLKSLQRLRNAVDGYIAVGKAGKYSAYRPQDYTDIPVYDYRQR